MFCLLRLFDFSASNASSEYLFTLYNIFLNWLPHLQVLKMLQSLLVTMCVLVLVSS